MLLIPGFCSSGLEVLESQAMPSWKSSRVWFNLQKLARARTQHSGHSGENATVEGGTDLCTVYVERARDLSLDAVEDYETIDGAWLSRL